MHPILYEIPLNYWMVTIVGLLFAAGGLIRTRFVGADKDASYLASFLGLNVKWGEIAAPWNKAVIQGLSSGASAAATALAVKYVAGLGLEQDRIAWLDSILWKLHVPSFQATKIPLHIYGLMMATGFVVGIGLAIREAKHEQMPPVPYLDSHGKQYVDRNGKKVFLTAAEIQSDLGFYQLIAGLVGSRILYIITRWKEDYAPEPLRIFKFWEGGLVWYGGLLAATFVTAWFVRRHKVAFLPYGDATVVGVSIAHGIGRLGCFAAGCCFGNPSTGHFPFAVEFPPGSPAAADHWGDVAGATLASLPLYPTQIMEAMGEVVIFFILLQIRRRKRFHGQVLLSYFFLYAILRTVMEMFRGDKIRGFVFKWPSTAEYPMLLSTSQAVSICVAIAGIGLTIALIRARNRSAHAAF